jgi:hypothetical protein
METLDADMLNFDGSASDSSLVPSSNGSVYRVCCHHPRFDGSPSDFSCHFCRPDENLECLRSYYFHFGIRSYGEANVK